MTKDDAKVQRELAEINARFPRHERMTRWVLVLDIVLVALALVSGFCCSFEASHHPGYDGMGLRGAHGDGR